MFSSMVVVVFVCIIFFMFYKRQMLREKFFSNVTSSTQHFQEQLQQTADIVIKRLEEQITHLEYLIEEANTKIINLDNKIQEADIFIKKEFTTNNEKNVENKAITHTRTIKLDKKNQNTDNFLKKENTNKNKDSNEEIRMADKEPEEHTIKKLHVDPIHNIAMAINDNVKLSIENYKDMARNDKRSSIIAMTELGYDINQIAKTTGISKGEIMLLLQLNKK